MEGELEFFRTQHRHREVSEQGKGDEPDKDGFHGDGRLEGFAAVDIEPGEDEKDGGDTEVEEVVHDDSILRDEVTKRELKTDREASKRR